MEKLLWGRQKENYENNMINPRIRVISTCKCNLMMKEEGVSEIILKGL